MSYKEEKYIDSDGQELTKLTWDDGDVWYTNRKGLKHRLDGPAYIGSNGTEKWYKNDKLHRENGPAYIGSDGSKAWCLDGLRHREDGPAWIWCDTAVEYWLNGKRVSKKEIDLIWLKKQVDR